MDYNYNDNNNNNNNDYENTQQVEHDDPISYTMKQKKKPFRKKLLTAAAIALVLGVGAGTGYYMLEGSDSATSAGTANSTVSLTDNADSENIVSKVSTAASSSTKVYDVSDVAQNTMPSIVSVTCSQYVSNTNQDMYNYFFGNGSQYGTEGQNSESSDSSDSKGTLQESSAGTGIIIGENDDSIFVATNYHVIEGSDTVELTFNDDATASATIKGYNSDADLAVLEVSLKDLSDTTLSAIKVASIGDSDATLTGEAVIAIGNALGYGQSVTTGVVSALNREVQLTDKTMTLIQTDAAINPGNSGGALLNASGELIGINTVKYADSEVEGMGFAIPISDAVPIIEALINSEEIPEDEQGYLGITGADIDSQYQKMYGMPAGVYVSTVEDGSPAQAAGMIKGSIITKFDGTEVTSMDTLSELIKSHASGDTVKITIMIADKGTYVEQELSVTLTSKAE